MSVSNIKAKWVDGDLVFYDNSGTEIARFDADNAGFDITKLYKDGAQVTATADEINNVADVSARIQEITEDGAVTAGVQSVEFNNDASETVDATIADASNHQGLFIVKDVSNDNTQNHKLTLTSGTFNGTNDEAALNAAGEALIVYFDSNGNGTVVENVASVSLSSST